MERWTSEWGIGVGLVSDRAAHLLPATGPAGERVSMGMGGTQYGLSGRNSSRYYKKLYPDSINNIKIE
jgi:hypothetical protein